MAARISDQIQLCIGTFSPDEGQAVGYKKIIDDTPKTHVTQQVDMVKLKSMATNIRNLTYINIGIGTLLVVMVIVLAARTGIDHTAVGSCATGRNHLETKNPEQSTRATTLQGEQTTHIIQTPEREICNDATNFALNMDTNQSSTNGHNSDGQRAVDGDRDTNYHHYSCTHTSEFDVTQPWWQVDLGTAQTIRKTVIVNRGDCCAYRLYNFEVRVGNDPAPRGLTTNALCYHYQCSAGKAAVLMLDCITPVTGRYLTVSLLEDGILTLCEVEAYGDY